MLCDRPKDACGMDMAAAGRHTIDLCMVVGVRFTDASNTREIHDTSVMKGSKIAAMCRLETSCVSAHMAAAWG